MYKSLLFTSNMIFILAIFAAVLCIVLTEYPPNSYIDTKIEEELIKDIRNFLQDEEKVLRSLKEFKSHVERIHRETTEDENYLKNSINDFLIVKRMIMDWHFITTFASFNKHEFLNKLQKDVSIIHQHPGFPSLSNLTDTVLKIAKGQEQQGINSVREFVMTLTSEPYTELTASECSIFAEVLNGVNKGTLAESWETESKTLEALFEDPLMEISTIKK